MNWQDKRTTLYVLYCAIFVVLIVAILLIFRPQHANAPTAGHSVGTTATHAPAGSTAGKGGAKIVIKGITSKSNGSTSTTSPATVVTTGSLNNTGPGNVVGLFVGVSILGAWLWRRKLIRSVIR